MALSFTMPSAEHTQLAESPPRVASAGVQGSKGAPPPRVAIVLRPRSAAALGELALRFVVDLAPGLQIVLCVFALLPGFVLTATARHVFDLEWVWVWAIALSYGCAVRGVFVCASHHILLAKRPSVADVIVAWRSRAVADWVNTLVFLPVRALATVSLVGSFVARRLAFTRVVALSEIHSGKSLVKAMRHAARRSWFLTPPGGTPVGRVELLNVLVTLSSVGLSEILGRGIVEQLLMLDPESVLAELPAGGLFGLLGYFLSIPFTTAAGYLAYIDGRTRRGDWEAVSSAWKP